MTNNNQKFLINSNQLMVRTQLLMSVFAAAGAVFFFTHQNTFLGLIFSVLTVETFVLGLLTRKRFVNVDGTQVTYHGLIKSKTMDIAKLTDASLMSGKGSIDVILRNTDAEVLKISFMFAKKDIVRLAAYLLPFVTADGVKHDKRVVKFLEKYASKANS